MTWHPMWYAKITKNKGPRKPGNFGSTAKIIEMLFLPSAPEPTIAIDP